jgi:dTDP-4-dehydrorhamnose reductase
MKKVLITGAKGQIAKDIILELYKRNINYYAYDAEECNITNVDDIYKRVNETNAELIINCAAYTNVDKAESDHETASAVNSEGLRNLAIISLEKKIPIVHFSSAYVFDGIKNSPYKVSDIPNPLNVYGKTKLEGEQYIKKINPNHFIIRLSWLFGKGENNFVRKVISWSKKSSMIKIVDDQVSSPGYSVDLAKGIIDLIIKGSYGLYHLANDGNCSKYDWGKEILETISWKGTLLPCKTTEFKNSALRPLFSVLDSNNTYETIGYRLPEWRNATKRFLKDLHI